MGPKEAGGSGKHFLNNMRLMGRNITILLQTLLVCMWWLVLLQPFCDLDGGYCWHPKDRNKVDPWSPPCIARYTDLGLDPPPDFLLGEKVPSPTFLLFQLLLVGFSVHFQLTPCGVNMSSMMGHFWAEASRAMCVACHAPSPLPPWSGKHVEMEPLPA